MMLSAEGARRRRERALAQAATADNEPSNEPPPERRTLPIVRRWVPYGLFELDLDGRHSWKRLNCSL